MGSRIAGSCWAVYLLALAVFSGGSLLKIPRAAANPHHDAAHPPDEAPPVEEPPELDAPKPDEDWAFDLSALSQFHLPLGVQLHLHGFVSQGFIISTANDYLVNSRRGSFEFTEIGLNFNVQLTENLRLGMQLFSRDLGPIGNYAIKADWFNIDYRFKDWLGLRVGRVKMPFGLYNDSSDADAARVPVLLPQSLYPTVGRDFLLAVTGGELYGFVPLGVLGELEYRGYGGTIFVEVDHVAAQRGVRAINVPYAGGGRLMWHTPIPGLRAGGSMQALQLNIDYGFDAFTTQLLKAAGELPADSTGVVKGKLRMWLWSSSLEFVLDELLVAAEYGQWNGEATTGLGNEVNRAISEGGYVFTSYRVAPWFTPSFYYSLHFPDIEKREGHENYQHDIALTLRFDVTPFWLIKLEGHAMLGTAVVTGNGRHPPDPTWGLFLIKTTAYF